LCFVHWKDEEAAIAQQSLDGAMGCNAQHSLLLSFQARLVVLLFFVTATPLLRLLSRDDAAHVQSQGECSWAAI